MFRVDLINGAMGAQRLTNEALAEKAGVTPKVISAARNGKMVSIPSLQAIAEALGLTMQELFEPKQSTAGGPELDTTLRAGRRAG